jgi:hypothetical protein
MNLVYMYMKQSNIYKVKCLTSLNKRKGAECTSEKKPYLAEIRSVRSCKASIFPHTSHTAAFISSPDGVFCIPVWDSYMYPKFSYDFIQLDDTFSTDKIAKFWEKGIPRIE